MDIPIVNKLIILYFMDKMDVAMTESSILKVCYYENAWIEYVDCISTLHNLEESGFLFRVIHEKISYYSITPKGRDCISDFYPRLPSTMRTSISNFIKENRLSIRRKQEYSTSYQLNPDKSYTVILKIIDPTNPTRITMDLRFVVPNKDTAKKVAGKWLSSAPSVYSSVYEQLVE